MTGRILALIVLVARLLPASAHEIGTQRLPAACLERVGGGTEQEFLAFDRELRAALSSPDAAALTVLAAYPLRVNDRDGTILIADASTLAARIQTALPPAVRSAVAGTPLADVICTSSGIGYGHGVVWVDVARQFEVDRFVISTINLPSSPNPTSAGVDFVCRADDYRIVVDRRPGGALRYRAWNRPRAATDKPDLELANGTVNYFGTGACAAHVWTFTNGPAEYVVSELGCAQIQPDGAIGELTVSVNGVQKKQSFCY